MPLHLPGDLYTDAVLTRGAVTNWQKDRRFTAGKAFPRMVVDKPSGLFDRVKTEDLNRDEMAARGTNSPAAIAAVGYSQSQYSVPTESLAYELNDTARKAANATRDPAKIIPKVLAYKAAIRLERQMAKKFFGADGTAIPWYRTVTGGASDSVGAGTASGTRKYFNSTSTDLVAAVLEEAGLMSDKAGMDPDAMLFSRDAWLSFRQNDSVISALNVAGVPVSRNRPATLMEVAALLELDWVGVSKATYNTAQKGATESNAKIVPAGTALLYYRGAGASDDPGQWVDEMPVGGACQVWTDGAEGNPEGMRIRRFRNEMAGSGGSDHSEIDTFRDYAAVTPELGTFFTGMVLAS